MKYCLALALLIMMGGCGSTYTLMEGGWTIAKTDRGTCLTVHGDDDPEVVVVCIANPSPIRLPQSILDAACPKCAPESSDAKSVDGAAAGRTDGAVGVAPSAPESSGTKSSADAGKSDGPG